MTNWRDPTSADRRLPREHSELERLMQTTRYLHRDSTNIPPWLQITSGAITSVAFTALTVYCWMKNEILPAYFFSSVDGIALIALYHGIREYSQHRKR